MKHVFKYCNDDNLDSYVAKALFRAVLDDAFFDICKKLETDKNAADNYGELIEQIKQKMPNKDMSMFLDGNEMVITPRMQGEPFAKALEMVKLLFTEIQASYNKVDPSWTEQEPYELWLTQTTHPMSKEANKFLHYMKTYLIENTDD